MMSGNVPESFACTKINGNFFSGFQGQDFSFRGFLLRELHTNLHKGKADTKIKSKALKNGKGHFSGTRKQLVFSLLCFVTNNSSTVN